MDELRYQVIRANLLRMTQSALTVGFTWAEVNEIVTQAFDTWTADTARRKAMAALDEQIEKTLNAGATQDEMIRRINGVADRVKKNQ